MRSQDISGHGTAVAGVAAGNGSNSGGRYAGVAMQSELIVVKLGNPIQEGFPRTTELMMGIDYIIRKALELRMPVAVNISFGNTYGGHDGTTLLERYIDDVSNIWKSVFCIGTGNEAASAGHTSGRIISEGEETIQLAIQSRQSSISIQIWKEYTDQIEISIINHRECGSDQYRRYWDHIASELVRQKYCFIMGNQVLTAFPRKSI